MIFYDAIICGLADNIRTHKCERSYFYYSEAVFYSQQALTILSIYFFKDVHYADNYSQTVSKVLK